MKSQLEEIFHSGNKKFRLQYDVNSGDLYINNKKVAYDVRLTFWQNFFGFGVSLAVMIDCLINVLNYFK